MKLSIILTLAMVAASSASARIGENIEQLAARYGQPTREKQGAVLKFKKNDIYITATMWKGVCHGIRFSNKESTIGDVFGSDFVLPGEDKPAAVPPPPPISAPLTETQIKNLLTANSNGVEWSDSRAQSWRTMDGKLIAFKSGNDLVIYTMEFSTHEREKEEKKEGVRTDGF